MNTDDAGTADRGRRGASDGLRQTQAWAIAIHGGAGTVDRAAMTPGQRRDYEACLRDCLGAGAEILAAGGSSVDAVEAAVMRLEDAPLFNAGRGAVLTSDATHELDAAIMRGKDRAAGAVINLRHVRNPVALARRVMEASPHVVLACEGAERFARQQGVEMVPPDWFTTPLRLDQLARARAAGRIALDHVENDDPPAGSLGTVGAVARDVHGNLAAATSTGGMTNKAPGRVGDSPLIGAGTYAANDACAVSATGHGEMFIRLVLAHEIAALVRHGGFTLEAAARYMVQQELRAIGGRGGVVAVGASGPPVMTFNTSGMYRAAQCEGEAVQVGIFAD